MSTRRRIAVLASAVCVAAGVVVGAIAVSGSAAAAAGPTNLPLDQFKLGADYHQFDGINSALVSKLGVAPVHTVMDNANHDRKALPGSFSVPGLADGFRFDDPDNTDCKNFPQGITDRKSVV